MSPTSSHMAALDSNTSIFHLWWGYKNVFDKMFVFSVCFAGVVSNSLGSWEWLWAWSSRLHLLKAGSIGVYHNTILYVEPGNWTQSSPCVLGQHSTNWATPQLKMSVLNGESSKPQPVFFFNFLLYVYGVYVWTQVCWCHGVCLEAEGQPWVSLLTFHLIGARAF